MDDIEGAYESIAPGILHPGVIVRPQELVEITSSSETSSDSGISDPRVSSPTAELDDDESDDDPGQTISSAMRREEFKQTSKSESYWRDYLLYVDMKKVLKSAAFRLTLLQFARAGEAETLEFLLDTLNESQCCRMLDFITDDEGATALHLAAKNSHYDVCKKFISSGANVNIRDGQSRATPLHFAAMVRPKERPLSTIGENSPAGGRNDNETSVILLLEANGADVNEVDKEGQTALHCAAIKKNLLCVQQLLLCQGISIDIKDAQGMTALHLAAAHGYMDIVQALINKDASLHITDNDLMTPLHHACACGNLEIIRMIINQANRENPNQVSEMLHRVDAGKNTVMHIAVGKGHIDVVTELLSLLPAESDVNKMVSLPTSHGDTPLHIAASQGFLKICEKLILSGAEVDARNDSLATPLLLAAQHNYYEIVGFLTEREADLEARDKDDLTPLLLSSKQGHLETMSWLIEHGADVNATDKHDKTCLMLAVEDQRTDAVHELLKYDSILRLIDERDKNTNCVLHIAAKNGYLPIIKVLLDHGASIDSKNEDEATAMHLASNYGHHITLKKLLDHDKTAINGKDKNGNTALHLAAIEGHIKCVNTLIHHGGNVFLRNTEQMTPLDCACSGGWETTVSALLKARSPVKPIKGSRTTPLHEACTNGHANVVRLLLNCGADVTTRLYDGRNPLDCAIGQDRKDCVQALLEHDSWRDSLRNAYVDTITDTVVTPMRKLIAEMPDMAEIALTRSMSDNKKKWDNKKLEVTFDFEFLDDMYTVTQWLHKEKDVLDSGAISNEAIENGVPDVQYQGQNKKSQSKKKNRSISVPKDPENYEAFNDDGKVNRKAITYTNDVNKLKHNHPLMIMVSKKREGLLQHPVVTALLQYKWDKYGRLVYYLSFLLLTIFVVLLNTYMLLIPPPYTIDYFKSLANRRFYKHFTDAHLINYTAPEVCYSLLKSGTTYRGYVNVSESNHTCIEWSTTSTDSNLYPDAGLDKNYCRNPGSPLDRPWCFTSYSELHPEDIVREECNIPMCPVYIRNDDLERGTTCYFPFVFGGVEHTKCIQHTDGEWCAATPSYDTDGKWGFCSEVDPYCIIPTELKKPCGRPDTDKLNCEARGCCYTVHDEGLPTEHSECFQKFDSCSDSSAYCEVNKQRYGCEVDWMKATCSLTCESCTPPIEEHDSEEKRFLYLMSIYPDGTFDLNWKEGCYYLHKEAEKTWGAGCHYKGAWEEPVKITLLVFCVLNLLRAIWQPFQYHFAAITFLYASEWTLVLLTIQLVINTYRFYLVHSVLISKELDLYDPIEEEFRKETGIRTNVQWQCGVIAVFNSWLHLALMTQKIPHLGIYIIMFKKIFLTYSKFLPILTFFIFSFAYAFYALLQNQVEFASPGQSILKTTVMMIGDVDFTRIFLGGSEKYEEKVNYPVLTGVALGSFVDVMIIIIINLMIGLAVWSIMEIQQHAALEQIKLQAELVLDVELAIPNIIRKRLVRKSDTIKPNRFKGKKALQVIFEDKNLSTENLAKVVSTGKSDTEEIQESIQQLVSMMREVRSKTNDHAVLLKELLTESKEVKGAVDETADVPQQKITMDEEARVVEELPMELEQKSLQPSPVPMRSTLPALVKSESCTRVNGSLRQRKHSLQSHVTSRPTVSAFIRSASCRRASSSSGHRLYSSLRRGHHRSFDVLNKGGKKIKDGDKQPDFFALAINPPPTLQGCEETHPYTSTQELVLTETIANEEYEA